MSLFTWANKRIQLLTWFDLKLVGLSYLLIGLLLAKWMPSLLDINVWWYIIIAALGLTRVFYVIYFKK
ncbi:hypothetical protein ACFL0A_02570 [Patescibacteria group bacterium]